MSTKTTDIIRYFTAFADDYDALIEDRDILMQSNKDLRKAMLQQSGSDINNDTIYYMGPDNFERLSEGYHGKVSLHGNTITISIPFNQPIHAINAMIDIMGIE